MPDERTERCSAPLATKETQAKTATRAHSRTRQTTRRPPRRRPRWARRGKAGPSHTAGGREGRPLWEAWRLPIKPHARLHHQTILSQTREHFCTYKNAYVNAHSRFIHNRQKRGRPGSSAGERLGAPRRSPAAEPSRGAAQHPEGTRYRPPAHAATWVSRQGIMLSDKSQIRKVTFCMVPLTVWKWRKDSTGGSGRIREGRERLPGQRGAA